MIPTGALPLVVYRAVGYCGAGHEVNVVSDGTRAYAFGAHECPRVLREGATLLVDCGQPGTDDVACEQVVMFALDEPDTWTTAEGMRRMLASYGQQVER